MSRKTIINCPPLKGTTNYNKWCYLAEQQLKYFGHWSPIANPMGRCAYQALGQIAKEAYNREVEQSHAMLVFLLAENVQMSCRHIKKPDELWEHLKTLYQNQNTNTVYYVKRNLGNIIWRKGSWAEHVNKIRRSLQEIREIDPEEHVGVSKHIELLLSQCRELLQTRQD